MMKCALSLFVLLQFTLSVDVNLAVFNITVLDKKGHAVTGLTAASFRVLEDGREEKIRIFQADDIPATVGLVIDNSGSMQNKRQDVLSAATAFVDASHPDDEMFIVNFNGKASLALPDSMPFARSVSDLRAALQRTEARGTTALYDGLETALIHLNAGTRPRKALVLLSDGADNDSTATLKEVLRDAGQSSATIYCIGIYDTFAKDRDPGVLKQLAKLTGGEAYFPKRPADLNEVWPRIAGSIRGQYTIGYNSSNPVRDGAYRNVKIMALDNRGKPLEVRTRPGYFAPLP
jgi:Ca-activated chloride channel family protein